MNKVELNETIVQEWLISHEEDFTNKFVVNWLVNHPYLLEEKLPILHDDVIDISSTVKKQSDGSNSEQSDDEDMVEKQSNASDNEQSDASDILSVKQQSYASVEEQNDSNDIVLVEGQSLVEVGIFFRWLVSLVFSYCSNSFKLQHKISC